MDSVEWPLVTEAGVQGSVFSLSLYTLEDPITMATNLMMLMRQVQVIWRTMWAHMMMRTTTPSYATHFLGAGAARPQERRLLPKRRKEMRHTGRAKRHQSKRSDSYRSCVG